MAEGDPPSSSDKRSDFIAGALHRPTRGPTITELRCCLVAFAWVRGRWANARRRVPGKNAPAYGAGGEASAGAAQVGTPTEINCVANDAVSCEPVSAPNSLLTD